RDWRTALRGLERDRQRGLARSLEPIGADPARPERLLLGLRLIEGVGLPSVGRELGIDPWTRQRGASIERMVRQGRLERRGGPLSIPVERWLLADGTIAALL